MSSSTTGGGINQLASAIRVLANSSSQATSGISQLANGITGKLLAPLAMIRELVGGISSLVQLANPGTLWHFTRALNDFQAVIGQLVTPVLQGLTIYLRAMGDTWARLTPVIQPLFNQLGQSFANIAVGAGKIIEAMAPFIQLIVDGVVIALEKGAQAVAYFQGVITELIKTLAKIFGLESRFDPNRSGKGAAVYQPSVSSVEDFANRQFAESLKGINQNRGQGKPPEIVLPEIAAMIEKGQEQIKKIVIAVETCAAWFEKRQAEAGALGEGANAGAHGDIKGMLDGFRKALIS